MRIRLVLGKLVFVIAAVLLLRFAHGQTPAPPVITQRITLPASATAAPEAGGSVQFIGTATVLIRYQGLTILTDPNFLHKGEHVHLGYGLRARRLSNPAMDLAQLPPLDLVILSHLHEDHFDKLVQQQLNRDTLIVTTKEAGPTLQRMGFRRPVSLGTWEALEVSKGDARLVISAMPGRHGPAGVAALLPPVMGSMLDFAQQADHPHYRIYITGDTLVFDDIAQIPRRFPGVDLALLHLGGTHILKLIKVTMDAKDGVSMLRIIAPAHAIPIHYNDYDNFKSPLAHFQREVNGAELAAKVSYLKHGEIWQFSAR